MSCATHDERDSPLGQSCRHSIRRHLTPRGNPKRRGCRLSSSDAGRARLGLEMKGFVMDSAGLLHDRDHALAPSV